MATERTEPRIQVTRAPLYREDLGELRCGTCSTQHDLNLYCPVCKTDSGMRPRLMVKVNATAGTIGGECPVCKYVTDKYQIATRPQ